MLDKDNLGKYRLSKPLIDVFEFKNVLNISSWNYEIY